MAHPTETFSGNATSKSSPSSPPLQASRFEPTLSLVDAVLYEWDVASDVLRWSGNAASVLGLRNMDSLCRGAQWEQLTDMEALSTRHATIMGTSQRDTGEGVAYELEYPVRINGWQGAREVWIEDVGRWFADETGRPSRVQGMLRIITARHQTEQRLFVESRIDSLTGTFNRLRLLTILETTLNEAKRYQTSCGFAVLSLENVSVLNETYGVAIVDELIAGLGKRLRSRMRAGDALGRFSSTTFGIVLANCDQAAIEVACTRFLRCVYDEPIEVTHGSIPVRVSIAALSLPRYARTLSDAMSRISDTLAEVRAQGGGVIKLYSPDMSRAEEREQNLKLAEDLLCALNEGRVTLAFQPVQSIETGKPAWYEVLARIRGNDDIIADGVADYVVAAEKLGMVHLLDRKVLELAFTALQHDPALKLAVNVSACTINDPEWRDMLEVGLASNPSAATRLMVEITETMALTDLRVVTQFVEFLHGKGVQVAMDDFGSGHTSFRALRQLGVDVVKIDGTFVRDALNSQQDRAFVKAVVSLATELGCTTVAECIESEELYRLMAELGVTYVQGRLTGAPAVAPQAAEGQILDTDRLVG
jgi:diguanylate cyclase (GGDEF)-like protein